MTNEQTIEAIMKSARARITSENATPVTVARMPAEEVAALLDEIERLKAQLADSDKQEPASPEPGEWIEWRGGRSPPIPDGILHQARLRNGAELNENSRASAVAWDHQCSARDIIAYRIIS